MTQKNSTSPQGGPATNTKTKEFALTRIFDAPQSAIWKAWTDPLAVKKWWGPKGFTAPFGCDRPPCWRKISLLHAFA